MGFNATTQYVELSNTAAEIDYMSFIHLEPISVPQINGSPLDWFSQRSVHDTFMSVYVAAKTEVI